MLLLYANKGSSFILNKFEYIEKTHNQCHLLENISQVGRNQETKAFENFTSSPLMPPMTNTKMTF